MKTLNAPAALSLATVSSMLTLFALPTTAVLVKQHLTPEPTPVTNNFIINNYPTEPAQNLIPTDTLRILNGDPQLVDTIAQYASTHQGTYSVSITELNENQTHTTYNSDIPTITASTYKTFVAYSTIKQIETGAWTWESPTTLGPTVDYCFTIMLTDSDNDCAETLLNQMTFQQVQQDANDMGATETHFEPYNIHSTADNLTLLLTKLATGQLPISKENQTKWLNTMQNNIYRNGIPEGVNSANITGETIIVADKVGFQDNLLHDTAIIYSPKGTYVLTILTTDSSWENIAELASLIEANRTSPTD